MIPATAIEPHEKLALVWAERRQELVAMRIQYATTLQDGCKLYFLTGVEEIA
jgi:hypothetical protein